MRDNEWGPFLSSVVNYYYALHGMTSHGQGFTIRVVNHWNRLHTEAAEASSLETFKARLDGALSNLV